jgi:hypothetical protein
MKVQAVANWGAVDGYETYADGHVRTTADPGYRGECVSRADSQVAVESWTMARVKGVCRRTPPPPW